jgi:nucleoid DNA-binding protein
LKTAVAKASKQKEADVEAVFKALGPAIAEQIRAGREVNLPGVGVIRIVRVLGHKDLVGGRPAFIPSKNYIEFVPTSDVTTAASSPGAKPSRDAAAWEFTVDPNTGPGQRAAMIRAPNDPFATSSATGVSPGLRTPGTRTPSSRIP